MGYAVGQPSRILQRGAIPRATRRTRVPMRSVSLMLQEIRAYDLVRVVVLLCGSFVSDGCVFPSRAIPSEPEYVYLEFPVEGTDGHYEAGLCVCGYLECALPPGEIGHTYVPVQTSTPIAGGTLRVTRPTSCRGRPVELHIRTVAAGRLTCSVPGQSSAPVMILGSEETRRRIWVRCRSDLYRSEVIHPLLSNRQMSPEGQSACDFSHVCGPSGGT